MAASLATATANGLVLPEDCLQCDTNSTNTAVGAYKLCSDQGSASIWWQIPHSDGESYQEPTCVAAIEDVFAGTPMTFVVATAGVCFAVNRNIGSNCLDQIAENTLTNFLPSNSELLDEGEVADYDRSLAYLAETFTSASGLVMPWASECWTGTHKFYFAGVAPANILAAAEGEIGYCVIEKDDARLWASLGYLVATCATKAEPLIEIPPR